MNNENKKTELLELLPEEVLENLEKLLTPNKKNY